MIEKTQELYKKLKPIVEEYTKLHSTELEHTGITVPVEGKKAVALAEKVLKLQEEKLKPIFDEGQELMKEKEKLEAEYKKIQEKMKEIEDNSQGFMQAKGVLMNRLSPMLQKQMEGKLTEYQEMQTIARGKDGKPVIRIGDFLTAFVNGRKKQKANAIKEKEKSEDKMGKVDPKVGVTEEYLEEEE